MPALDASLDALDDVSASLRAQKFKAPRAYQNALLNRRDITALIRDAEAYEVPLFTVKHATGTSGMLGVSTVAAGTAAGGAGDGLPSLAGAASGPQRVRLAHDPAVRQVLRDREAEPELLLDACEKLVDMYPVDRARIVAQVELLRHKVAACRRGIAELESEVERGRAQLDSLSSGHRRADDVDDDDGDYTTSMRAQPESAFRGDASVGVDAHITQEMLDREEEEIRALEQQLADRRL